MDFLRFIAYFTIFTIIVIMVVKKSMRPRCDLCRNNLYKASVRRSVYGEEKTICVDCNDQFRENEKVPDFNNIIDS
jgi:hypothetical protein